ncbi:MAG: RidA family protein [Vicinamibacterales bacterium]
MFHLLGAAALGAAVAMAAMQTSRQIVNVGPAPIGPFSPAVQAGGLIYLSGTLAPDENGVVPGDVGTQTRRVVDKMTAVLEAAGSSLPQVVSATVYLKTASDFAAMNDVYRTFWPGNPPTRTTVITDLLLGARVEITMVAVANGVERRVIHPDDWSKSPNPYSYAIQTGDTLLVSGLVPRSPRDNSPTGGDISAQTRVVMDNAGEILRAAGMDHSNIVSARVYLPDADNFQQMNAVYRSYFKTGPPARATVIAGLAGPQYAVEITFVASSAPRQVVGESTNPNLSQAIKSGNRLYVSGLLGNTESNAGDATAQTKETLARLQKLLQTAGYTSADVVDGLIYLTDLSKFGEMNTEYRAFFQKDFPARATVGTRLVAQGAVVEIMVTAVKQ